MRMLFSILVGLVAGLIVGGWLGAQYYVHMGPAWGQYGYEFEGFVETAVGAAVGGLAGVAAGAARVLRRRRGRGTRQDAVSRPVVVAAGWAVGYVLFVGLVFATLTAASALGWGPSSHDERVARSLAVGLVATLTLWLGTRIHRSVIRRRDRAHLPS
jgi:hypothetical protein